MALARCLGHTPGGFHQSYARALRALKCDVTDCTQPAVICLDPEEVREYGWGARTFWESSSLMPMRAGDLGVKELPRLVALDSKLRYIIVNLVSRSLTFCVAFTLSWPTVVQAFELL